MRNYTSPQYAKLVVLSRFARLDGGVEIVVDMERQGFKIEPGLAKVRMQPRAV
jgi:hypothetical protein